MSAATPRVLVAGIGNVFLGDDGFGVEVVRRLRYVPLPERVDVVDYGIRGLHLAYDLLDGRHGLLILVDALPMGERPGTLGVVEVDLVDPTWTVRPDDVLETPATDAHGMDPETVLRLMLGLGGRVSRVLVVGCQPAVLSERMELSPAVRDAVDGAIRMVVDLVVEELGRAGVGEWSGSGGIEVSPRA